MEREVAARLGLCHPFEDPTSHDWQIHFSKGGGWRCSRCNIQDTDYYAQGVTDPNKKRTDKFETKLKPPNANAKATGRSETYPHRPLDPTARFVPYNLENYKEKDPGTFVYPSKTPAK